MAWPCLESNLRESSRVGPSYCTIYIGYQGHEVILDPCLDGMKGFQGNGEVVTVLMVGMYDRFIQMMPVTRTLGTYIPYGSCHAFKKVHFRIIRSHLQKIV